MFAKRVALATTALTGAMLMAGAAAAQSTASQIVEENTVQELVVTGQRGPREIEGFRAETAPRARVTIGQEFLETQIAGQTVFQTLNQTPGLNFTNNDPYGTSGGNVRLRGFDGNRIALTFDGIPLNDTGNYAIYTNQQLDSELIEQANVNTGTSEVDAPSAAAVGGTINYVTVRPEDEFTVQLKPSVGSWGYYRVFGRVDPGAIGPFGTTAFGAASYQRYDKFRGPGDLEKEQYNARIYQEYGDGDFISVGFHYNENRNNFYRNLSLADFYRTGGSLDNDKICRRLTPGAGVQNENTGNTVVTSLNQVLTGTNCTNYHGLRINPSNTGNVRGQASYTFNDQLRLTFDPYFQYTLANGGGFTALAETDGRLRGASTAAGSDINGDGDTLDTVTIYTPSNTNTRRYGFTSSLIYDLTEQHQFRLAYTVDYGRHRQTGEAGLVGLDGEPEDVFGGKDGYGARVRAADNSFYRTRDRFSIASLQQVAAQYRGRLLDDRLILDIGVRAPFFKRELNQYCYTQDAVASRTDLTAGFAVRCTTETPIASPNNNGAVRFATTGTTDFIRPYEYDIEYDDVLPNVGVSYEFADNHRVYAQYAEGFAAPRTDNLYSVGLLNGTLVPLPVQPESNTNYDVGYRFNSPNVQAYLSVFYNEFQNRIVQSFDQDLGFSVDRNVGAVEQAGVDWEFVVRPVDMLVLRTFGEYLNAEIKENIAGSTAGSVIPTAGKQLVEVPEWQFGGRVELEPVEGLQLGLQYKHVDSRYSNDINTEEAPAYDLWDFDAQYSLERFGYDDAFVQLNVTNLFDERYLGNISSSSTGAATFSVGAPLTVQVSLNAQF